MIMSSRLRLFAHEKQKKIKISKVPYLFNTVCFDSVNLKQETINQLRVFLVFSLLWLRQKMDKYICQKYEQKTKIFRVF
jgi:hypothetical protein